MKEVKSKTVRWQTYLKDDMSRAGGNCRKSHGRKSIPEKNFSFKTYYWNINYQFSIERYPIQYYDNDIAVKESALNWAERKWILF